MDVATFTISTFSRHTMLRRRMKKSSRDDVLATELEREISMRALTPILILIAVRSIGPLKV